LVTVFARAGFIVRAWILKLQTTDYHERAAFIAA